MKNSIPLVTDQTFAEEVLSSAVPVIVDFGAEWCGPCRALEPVLDKLAKAQEGKVRVVRIDADESPETTARYGVRSLPTIVTFVAGEVFKRHTGLTSLEGLTNLLPTG